MRPLFTVVLLLATMASAATAQTLAVDSRTAAVRLSEALNWREVMESVRAEQLANVKSKLRERLQQELGSPTTEEYSELETTVDELASKYTLDDTIADLVTLFQTHYSAAEMEALATFFSSPLFKKFEAEKPKINFEALETMNRKMQPAIQEAVQHISARIDEMKKARSNK